MAASASHDPHDNQLPTRRPYSSQTWVFACFVVIVAALYGGLYLKRGWIPHDDGAFALSAERVLHGELPHHEFDDLYTGGLTFLNAAAMKLFGEDMAAIRYPAFILFLFWIPAVFNIARRFISDQGAALVTFLAISLSFPNYSSAVPSWYNLFFATFGVLALFRFAETNHRFWLAIAGMCAGLSFLAKLSGLYFLAAVLLFLVHHEQEVDRRSEQPTSLSSFATFIALCCAALVVVLLKFINWNHDPRYLIHFVVPGSALAALLVWREFTATYCASGTRFKRLFADATPVVLGFVAPTAVFLVPYLLSGSVNNWFEGVFVLPMKRLAFASHEPASLKWVNLLATTVLVFGLMMARNLRNPLSRTSRIVIAVLLAAAVIVAGFQKGTYHFLWFSLVLLFPATTVIVSLSRRCGPHLFALSATAALCSLVQYPYAAPIYLVYVLPLIALVWLAYITEVPNSSRFLAVALTVAYLAFFALRVTPSYVNAMGLYYTGNHYTQKLAIPRAGGLRVEPAQADEYEQVMDMIRQHRRGDYTFAAIDCPEIYFLSGLKSPSRSLFDFFEDSPGRDQQILDSLAARGVNVITIKTPDQTSTAKLGTPSFSVPLDSALLAELKRRYPNSQEIGQFEVRWNQ